MAKNKEEIPARKVSRKRRTSLRSLLFEEGKRSQVRGWISMMMMMGKGK